MKTLNYLADCILYEIFKIISSISLTDNPPIKMYLNKIEKRTTFKIKTRYYLKLLAPGTMKLL